MDINKFNNNSNKVILQQIRESHADTLNKDINELHKQIDDNVDEITKLLKDTTKQLNTSKVSTNTVFLQSLIEILKILVDIIELLNQNILTLKEVNQKLVELKTISLLGIVNDYIDIRTNEIKGQVDELSKKVNLHDDLYQELKMNDYQHEEIFQKLQEFEQQLSTVIKEVLSIVKDISTKQIQLSEEDKKLKLQKFKYTISLITQLLSSGGVLYLIVEKLLSK